MIHFIIQLVLVLLLPPLLLGTINKVKAWFGGRVGPPWLQVYYDLWKLAQKDTVLSHTTTWIFRFGPMVVLVTTLAAALMLPLHPDRPAWFTGDFLLFAYLLALGRFFMVLAAADTGSAFEGMGAAREFTYACLGEPILFFGLLVLAKATEQFDLAGMFAGKLTTAAAGSHGLIYAALLLVMVSWFILLLVENCRVPFDDPNTHLELTMIHEVMVLDHSGPALGVIVYSAGLKMFLFAGLVVRLLAPLRTGNEWADWGLIIAGILLVTVAVGVTESVMARLRLIAIPRMLAAAGVLAGFALVILVSAFMNLQLLDPLLILVLLLNFAILASASLRIIIFLVAAQGFVLAALYPIAHGTPHAELSGTDQILDIARLYGLTAVMAAVKGIVIPWLLLKAMREADVPHQIDPIGGLTPTLIVAAIGTALTIIFSKSLTSHEVQPSGMVVPAALATVFAGFLLLSLRREVLTQVIGYLVLENGIFIFGLLLVTAIPIMVEIGVLLDLFVGIFVMAIVVNHVSRALPSASTEHLTTLRE